MSHESDESGDLQAEGSYAEFPHTERPYGINPGVLLVELIMSADRIITASELADNPVNEDEWDAATILGHLTEVDEQVWHARLDVLLAENYQTEYPDGASFPWWEPDSIKTREHFLGAERAAVAADFLAMRTTVLMKLRGIEPSAWATRWQHESRGELTLTDLILWILEHDEEHRGSILKLAKK